MLLLMMMVIMLMVRQDQAAAGNKHVRLQVQVPHSQFLSRRRLALIKGRPSRSSPASQNNESLVPFSYHRIMPPRLLHPWRSLALSPPRPRPRRRIEGKTTVGKEVLALSPHQPRPRWRIVGKTTVGKDDGESIVGQCRPGRCGCPCCQLTLAERAVDAYQAVLRQMGEPKTGMFYQGDPTGWWWKCRMLKALRSLRGKGSPDEIVALTTDVEGARKELDREIIALTTEVEQALMDDAKMAKMALRVDDAKMALMDDAQMILMVD